MSVARVRIISCCFIISNAHLEKRYLVTAAYDGQVRFFDRSQKLVNCASLHSAPITSFCFVPLADGRPEESEIYTIATASHDLTAQLTRVSLSPEDPERVVPLATCHLHTGPVSSICSDHSGSRLLTSSWDGLIGLWDTSLPPRDEVPPDQSQAGDRKKRRKIDQDDNPPKRKAPLSVLKSHTARVSKVVFGQGQNDATRAYSCGFDSTIRTWDVENGICTDTIVREISFSILFYLQAVLQSHTSVRMRQRSRCLIWCCRRTDRW
jgi:ribosome biogenesis protein YTM1